LPKKRKKVKMKIAGETSKAEEEAAA